MRLIEILLAQATSVTSTTQPAGNAPPPIAELLRSFGPLILIVVVFYFLMSSSKRKQAKEHQSMLDQIKRGDRIQTIGGILGTVIEARDTEVIVKVDESSNTKIRFARSAIHKVMEEEKTDSK